MTPLDKAVLATSFQSSRLCSHSSIRDDAVLDQVVGKFARRELNREFESSHNL